MKNPFLSCPYLVKKMSILSKLHYTIGQKVNRIPLFFRIFTIKYCSHAHILSKNVHSLINTLSSRPYFVQKCPFAQKHSVLASFFSKVSWKTPAVMPIFDQQTSILSKLAYYMSQNSQWDAPFTNYHEKMTALMSVFYQNNV